MSGEYVMFLDSDDFLVPEAVEKSINVMLANDVDIVIYKCAHCKTTRDKKLKKLFCERVFPDIPQGLYTGKQALNATANREINVTAWNKLSKREIWKNLRFPKGFVYEDLFIILKLMNKVKNIYVIDDILILHRIRNGSIVSTKTVKNIKDLINSWSVFEKFVETHIPDIFDYEQLQRTREKILNEFVLHYAKMLSMSFPEKATILDLMREKIENTEKNFNIKNCIF